MEESTGEGGWPILKRKHGDAMNFPPAAVYIHLCSLLFAVDCGDLSFPLRPCTALDHRC